MKFGFIAPAVAALCTLVTARALAADAPNEGRTPPTDTHLRGLELTLRPALGSAPSTSPVRFAPSSGVRFAGDPGALLTGASPYGAGFVGQVFLGYRFHPLVSGGLRGGLRTSSASSLSDGSTGLERSAWDAGFYVRGYPLALMESVRKYVDPWISVGVGYTRDVQSFRRAVPTSTGGTVNADWMLDHHSVVIPIAIGLDYRVLPMLSVGPSFEYALASAVAGCAKQSAPGFTSSSLCTNEEPGKSALKAEGYGVWSAGIDLRLTLF